MNTRKPTEAAAHRTPGAAPPAISEAGVRAALRQRRLRRAHEAGLQSLVRTLAAQMPPERGR